MIFGQLSARESLRDLIIVIEAHQSKSYHLGFGKNVTRSNLSKANENRNYKILVRMRGLEPRKQRPKRCVLPLHHTLLDCV